MLIMSRKVAESLHFGENKEITIEILGIESDSVRLGINVLNRIPVCRGEVYQKNMQSDEHAIVRVKL